MAEFKVLKSCKNKEDDKYFKKNETVNETVKYVKEFEDRLEKAGYQLPFFKRKDK
ncbi:MULTISPECIES: hypothetical protein [unclassified Staphylococcus]|uniref:hypothetical protein n=1 Tax=unclassified Staphylococcus TaxID=91994 RepID=UPI00159F622F|nr:MULTISPECIES: hypothetical protein [unclassified Staphylococcus]